MALTRTKLSQADTSVAKIQDPVIVLNNGSNTANVDVGFVINRDHGVSSNVALVWNESGNTFVVAFTNDTGITNSNINVSSHANVTAGTIIVNTVKTDNFLYSNGNPFSPPASSYAQIFVADNLSSGNALFTAARITGNLQVEGNLITIGQQNLTISDSVIDLHTQANLAPWTFNDGKDIGLKFHYYRTEDEHAFLGFTTDNYLEWYDSGREVGNVFTGNTYGSIKAGEIWLANTTTSSNNTTGALRVAGGAGIAGRLNVGGNILANSGTASSSTTTGAVVVRGGIGISGDAYVGGLLDADSIQNTAIGTVTPNSGYFTDLYSSVVLKSEGNIVAYSGAASTNTTTGALIAVGGVGISGAVHIGSTVKSQGNIVAASGVASTNTTTGALVVDGGAGISGNVYSSAVYTSGLFWAGNNQSITGPATGSSGTIQFNNGGVLGATNIIYDNATGNVVFTDGTPSSSTTTGAVVIAGGIGVGANLVASGLVGTHYGSLFLGTTDINLARTSGAQVLTGIGIDGTAGTATNAINTQVTSNISAGTSYVTFVNSTSGNTAQNINTSLTYNPNSGNLRAYGIQTDTGVYWAANGAAFSSSPGGTSGQLQYNNNNLFTGANIVFNNTNGNLVVTSVTDSISTTTGAFLVRGGVGIGANLNVGGNLVITSTTTASSTTSGALLVSGGVGIGGELYSAGGINLNNGLADGPGIKFQSLGNTEYEIDSSSGNLRFFQPGIVRFVVDKSGNVGVANSTPLSNLSVTGTTYTTGNITTAGWIMPTSNVTQNLGTTTSWWGTFYGVSTQARYADLAENYVADAVYEAGTVVIFGGDREITTTDISHDTRVAGVISTNPGYLMNASNAGLPVAFTGRVPCRVLGPVDKGTVLVSSSIPGVAEAMNNSLYRPGCVIGKSLEKIADNEVHTVEVVVGRF